MSIVKMLPGNKIIVNNAMRNADLAQAEVVDTVTKLTFDNGEMESRLWVFDGIRIIHSEARLKKPSAFEWDNALDIVHLHFNLAGRTIIDHRGFKKQFKFNALEHNISYANGFKGVVHYEELNTSIFIIQFSKEVFLDIIQNAGDQLIRFGEDVLKGEPVKLSEHNLNIDLQLYAAIQSVLKSQLTGRLKKLFLHSKCVELLVLQAEAFEKTQGKKYIYCKTEYDKERILFAREYLLQHYDVPPTLPELAHIAGINEFKLKRGFKEVFGNTVFGYLTDYKMELAKSELAQGIKTISQLAYDLGYSSVPHFSTVFKKKFGYSPSAFDKTR